MDQDSPPPTDTQLLHALLASRDVACPVCAYNLRGIESGNCPECGANLELRVGSMDLKLGLWLTALLCVALPLGFVSIYAVYSLVVMASFAFGGSGSEVAGFLLTLTVPVLVCVAYALLLWRLIRHRRKFWAKPRRAQWRSVVLYAVLGPGILLTPLLLLLLAFLRV